MKRQYYFFLVALGLLLAIGQHNCTPAPPAGKDSTHVHDLPQIKDSGRLVALMPYSSTTYFIYRGEPMGFQYEIAEQFARSLGVELEVRVANNEQEMERMLLSGEGDLIAYNLPVTRERRDSLTFCGEDFISHQVLIQRKDKKKKSLTDVTQLPGKDIYVKPGKYADRLHNLDKELGGGIRIHEVKTDSISEEDLIAQVAGGQIDYTVSDNAIARLNKTYFPNLDIDLKVGFDQRASWAVRKDQPRLAEAANSWHKQNVTTPAYKASTKRYFEKAKQQPHGPILSAREGRISVYDDLFKKYAAEIGWDWRLMASLAYTESNFDTSVVSWAGAKGLMQLMPRTARAMGVPEGREHNAEESVKAATRYLQEMTRSFSRIADKDEQINFVLASYNAGIGHIYDAMALAEKHGYDRYRWFDCVEKFLLLKSKPEYFNDPVCRNGYFRGVETYNFVRDIKGRHKVYQQKIKE